MAKLLLALFLSFLSWQMAWAQKAENLYAAPGMPVALSHRLPAGAAPITKPWLTEPLPRFWKSPDSLTRQQGDRQLKQAVAQRLHYPKLALIKQLGGIVLVQVTISANGKPLAATIIESTLTLELPDKTAGESLQNEALRVAQLLRFQPGVTLVDTVVVPVTYRYE